MRSHMTPAAKLLVDALRNPSAFMERSPREWTDIISIARRELVIGHLAAVLKENGYFNKLPERLQEMLEDGLRDTLHSHRLARSEANFTADALHDLGCKVIVLKGSAYVLAGLSASKGRFAGDLDLLVPRSFLGAAEIALKKAGWRIIVKDDYDDQYYRLWMHELPPFQHGMRKTLIDLHHTILPLTNRVTPNASALVRDAIPMPGTGLFRFCNVDMILHSAAHLIQDGDLYGGLRNLHDIHRLIGEFSGDSQFWDQLREHALKHNLQRCLYYALTCSAELFGTKIPDNYWTQIPGAKPAKFVATTMRWMMHKRLTGREVGAASVQYLIAEKLLYMRAHYMRMPPLMLAKHLARKQVLRWRAKSKS
jgi:Uncharacterised nucleotidyltransferase